MKAVRAFLPFSIGLLAMVTAAGARDKDLRTRTDAAGETAIGFCSRPSPDAFGFPGHAFVTFSESTNTGMKFRAVGHTVATGNLPAVVFTYFGGRAVAGKQMEERFTHMKQACLTVKVDRNIFDAAINAARPTLSQLGLTADALAVSAESYALNGNDCIDFRDKRRANGAESGTSFADTRCDRYTERIHPQVDRG